jgi:flagellar motor switch protein FliG
MMPQELSGYRKAAVLLWSLEPQQAEDILRRLPPQAASDLRRELHGIAQVPSETRQAVFRQFCREAAHATAPSDQQQAAHEQATAPSTLGAFDQTQGPALADCLGAEHPQTIALLLVNLPAEQASELLSSLSGTQQVEVMRRVAALQQAHPQVLHELGRGLEDRLQQLRQSVLRIHACDQSRSVRQDRAAASWLTNIEDLLLLDEEVFQLVLDAAPPDEMALAMCTASEQLRQRVLSQLPFEPAGALRDQLRQMGPVRLSDVEEAQRRLLDLGRQAIMDAATDQVAAGFARPCP